MTIVVIFVNGKDYNGGDVFAHVLPKLKGNY
jgi:hypothetical protein